MTPFSAAFQRAVHFGYLAAVHLPDSKEPVPEAVLAQLDDAEREHALTLSGYRQVDWVGGRLALRGALGAMDRQTPPLLVNNWGAPVLPDNLAGSISHKRTLAVGLIARSRHGSVGIDLEDLSPPRERIAPRVLLPEELAAVEALPPERRWTAIVLRFSMKEAIYKALHPFVHRYVDFKEALVTPDVDCTADVQLRLAKGEGPFRVEARYTWLPGRVLTQVRIREPRPSRPRRRKKRKHSEHRQAESPTQQGGPVANSTAPGSNVGGDEAV